MQASTRTAAAVVSRTGRAAARAGRRSRAVTAATAVRMQSSVRGGPDVTAPGSDGRRGRASQDLTEKLKESATRSPWGEDIKQPKQVRLGGVVVGMGPTPDEAAAEATTAGAGSGTADGAAPSGVADTPAPQERGRFDEAKRFVGANAAGKLAGGAGHSGYAKYSAAIKTAPPAASDPTYQGGVESNRASQGSTHEAVGASTTVGATHDARADASMRAMGSGEGAAYSDIPLTSGRVTEGAAGVQEGRGRAFSGGVPDGHGGTGRLDAINAVNERAGADVIGSDASRGGGAQGHAARAGTARKGKAAAGSGYEAGSMGEGGGMDTGNSSGGWQRNAGSSFDQQKRSFSTAAALAQEEAAVAHARSGLGHAQATPAASSFGGVLRRHAGHHDHHGAGKQHGHYPQVGVGAPPPGARSYVGTPAERAFKTDPQAATAVSGHRASQQQDAASAVHAEPVSRAGMAGDPAASGFSSEYERLRAQGVGVEMDEGMADAAGIQRGGPASIRNMQYQPDAPDANTRDQRSGHDTPAGHGTIGAPSRRRLHTSATAGQGGGASVTSTSGSAGTVGRGITEANSSFSGSGRAGADAANKGAGSNFAGNANDPNAARNASTSQLYGNADAARAGTEGSGVGSSAAQRGLAGGGSGDRVPDAGQHARGVGSGRSSTVGAWGVNSTVTGMGTDNAELAGKFKYDSVGGDAAAADDSSSFGTNDMRDSGMAALDTSGMPSASQRSPVSDEELARDLHRINAANVDGRRGLPEDVQSTTGGVPSQVRGGSGQRGLHTLAAAVYSRLFGGGGNRGLHTSVAATGWDVAKPGKNEAGRSRDTGGSMSNDTGEFSMPEDRQAGSKAAAQRVPPGRTPVAATGGGTNSETSDSLAAMLGHRRETKVAGGATIDKPGPTVVAPQGDEPLTAAGGKDTTSVSATTGERVTQPRDRGTVDVHVPGQAGGAEVSSRAAGAGPKIPQGRPQAGGGTAAGYQ